MRNSSTQQTGAMPHGTGGGARASFAAAAAAAVGGGVTLTARRGIRLEQARGHGVVAWLLITAEEAG
jgi:hypothetical protein